MKGAEYPALPSALLRSPGGVGGPKRSTEVADSARPCPQRHSQLSENACCHPHSSPPKGKPTLHCRATSGGACPVLTTHSLDRPPAPRVLESLSRNWNHPSPCLVDCYELSTQYLLPECGGLHLSR